MSDLTRYSFFVQIGGDRPPFYSLAVFLWGENCNIDSDGDSSSPLDPSWTELTLSNRAGLGHVSIDPVSANPLTLAVEAADQELAARAAYYLASVTKGKCSADVQGPFFEPEHFNDRLGKFDLDAAFARAAKVKMRQP